MRILRAILILLALALATAVVQCSLYKPAYDTQHLNHAHYAVIFEQLRLKERQNLRSENDSLDVSVLNDGQWKVACAFGGYTDPVKQMKALGANITEKDERRFEEARHGGTRLGPIEEFEFALAYIDLDNNGHFIHFQHGIGANGQHLRRCIAAPQKYISLATREPAVLLFPTE